MTTHGFFARSPHNVFVRSSHGFRDTIAATAFAFISSGSVVSAYASDLTTLIWQANVSKIPIAIGVNETIFVVALSGGTDTVVRQLDCATGTQLWQSTALSHASVDVETDATNVYTHTEDNVITKWLPGTGSVWSNTYGFGPDLVRGFTVDLSGNIFVVGVSGGVTKIHKIDSSGTEVTTGGWPLTITFSFSTQGHMKCDSSGNVYYLDDGVSATSIYKVDSSASAIWTLAPPSTYNWQRVFVDGNGNVYGTGSKLGGGIMVAYDNADPPVERWRKTYAASPLNVAFDDTGNVYVGNPLTGYNSSGVLLAENSAGGLDFDVLPGRPPHFQ